MSIAAKKNLATNNLPENLQSIMSSYNIGITKLSKDLNLPVMTIRRILNGSTTDPRISTLENIATYFSISIDELLKPTLSSKNRPPQSKPEFIPIVSWNFFKTKNLIAEYSFNDWKTWLPISLDNNETIGEKVFALKARPSMHPRFPQGTFFIIDPCITPKDGDLVLINMGKETTLRTLLVDAPAWQLQSIIPGADIFTYNPKQHHILGITILTLLFRNQSY
ncbi:MAG: helix-turn-helix domain-containing protein [Coxiellaceae bacterium]|nr:helix-turn-helix domain-containing protein [Coxiellaceae bacterium]